MLTILEKCVISIIKLLTNVKHIAIIMDGNRRFAKSMSLDISKGHECGFNNLIRIANLCYYLGINTLTVYGLSLLNFRRSKKEINDLIDLFIRVIDNKGELIKFADDIKCKIRFCGDLSFIGDDVVIMIKDVENRTSVYNNMTLNICVAYGARNEIANTIKRCKEDGVSIKNTRDFYNKLYTGNIDPPNILIRTSGVTRLSDFLIYQCSEFTSLYFVNEMWPELNIWRIIYIVIHHLIFQPSMFNGTNCY